MFISNDMSAEQLRNIFSKNLNLLLENKGHSKIDLANYMGVSTSTVSDWCGGKKYPRMDKIEKMAGWLGVMKSQLTEIQGSTNVPFGLSPLPRTVKKPRLGTIVCGDPIECPENFDGYDDVPESIRCDFTLKCKGDSMVGARINDGDLVYIRQQSTVDNGQVAAVCVDGDMTLKRVYWNGNTLILQPENPKYTPYVYAGPILDNVQIVGLAVGFTSLIK